MATAEQVTELITLMQGQMTLLQQQRAGGEGTKSKRPDRPVINSDIDDQDWALFLDTWPRYKTMAGVTGVGNIRMELRAACSTEVNRMMFQFVGPTILDACSEEDLLAHIKSVAVRQVHHEVHQMKFNMMMQDEGESITHYVARLKAQACLCQFEIECGCDPVTTVSYADKMVAQRLVAGLCNHDHLTFFSCFAEAASLKTLNEKIKRLQLWETTDKSSGILRGTTTKSPASEAALQRSQYKQNQRQNTGAPPQPESVQTNEGSGGELCRGCGAPKHPGGRKDCPAKTKKCFNCNRKGHLSTVCDRASSRSSSAQDNTQHEDSTETLPSLPSNASMSFSFSAQDFRPGNKNSEGT